MAHSEKNTRLVVQATGQKSVTIPKSAGSYYGYSLSFSFRRYDSGASWAVSSDGKPTIDSLFYNMRGLEFLRWSEILHASGGKSHGTNSHSIAVKFLSDDAKARAESISLNESEMFSLRLQGQVRLWGIVEQSNGCFYVIWYDPNHKVYPLK